MKTTHYLTAILFLIVLCTSARADHYRTTYEQSFNTDPHWTTNNPSECRWESAAGTYHCTLSNQGDAIAFVPIDWDGQSMRLTYDVKINSCGFSAGSTFGLFNPLANPNQECCVSDYSIGDCGDAISIYGKGPACNYSTNQCPSWQTAIWYTNVLTYDATTHMVHQETRRRQTGVLVATIETSISCGFSSNLDSLGVSRRGSGEGTAVVDFEIDNVRFEVVQTCESADFDQDGDIGTDADIEAFFRVLAGDSC